MILKVFWQTNRSTRNLFSPLKPYKIFNNNFFFLHISDTRNTHPDSSWLATWVTYALITCVIMQPNPRRLFSFHASSSEDHYLIEVLSQLVSLVKHFFINYTWNAFKMKIAVINDNNNFAPSLFRSLCEFYGDCFGPQYFSLGELGPKQSPSISHNDLKKDVVQL